MGSSIEWTEETLNTWTGCGKVSAGCANCYIDRQPPLRIAHRKFVKGRTVYVDSDGVEVPGQTTPLRYHMERLDAMVRRRKPTMYFVNSMSDTFHEDVPDELITHLFAAMAVSPQHTFQVLTKRPRRMQALLSSPDWKGMLASAIERRGGYYVEMVMGAGPPVLPNVWLGVTVENRSFTWRADVLRATPAAVRFLSCEPLLGPLVPHLDSRSSGWGAMWWEWDSGADGERVLVLENRDEDFAGLDLAGIDWLIAGGESGPDPRPCRVEWLRDLRDACRATGTPCPRCNGEAGKAIPPGSQFGATESFDPKDFEVLWCPECGFRGNVDGTRFFLKQLGGHPDKRGGGKAILDRQLHHDMPGVCELAPTMPAQGSLSV